MIDPDTLKKLREDAAGMRGRFFYDPERGDIAFIAKDCDDKVCDCEVKKNADGDQDCSLSFDDFWGEDHICEPIVRMLNAVPALLDAIAAHDPLRLDYLAAHLALVDAGLASNDGREHTVAERVRGLVEQRDAAIREADRLRHGVPVEGDFVCPDSLDLNRMKSEGQRIDDTICALTLLPNLDRAVWASLCNVHSQLTVMLGRAITPPVPSGEEEA